MADTPTPRPFDPAFAKGAPCAPDDPCCSPAAETVSGHRTFVPDPDAAPVLSVEDLHVTAGRRPVLRGVDLAVRPGEVLALVGPSGVGKSTLLRCLNRLVDLDPGLSVTGGRVRLAGEDVYRRGLDVDALRTRIGMLFQQPVVFPGSILDNAVFGLRHASQAVRVPRREHRDRAEQALRGVGLWPEVADRLDETAAVLSVGQQQRLCLARALALEPEVLLMDEPTSALDPRSTTTIERLVQGLAGETTVVIVTHDPGQARRVAHRAACLAPDADGAGRIVGCDACDTLFRQPGLMDLFGERRDDTGSR